ncbi:MAG: 50S ribosomal protein L4 [Flavobacteriales bacterium]|jgi:large subunit ribosomal protein L4|uniref:50S ribosomal protein L4 n=1 Tax=Blattabacterium sp. (Mastotermes darwiniensis) TaxID=39768 RepID=UPI000231DE72|nr:50S ribosomal protein L4 [Blattabacterium sp. (Mastotermes darwiniensis)]AER40678.1 50S ribosomal protein L4 [Blattabacterium sp. (Mastotermes darwiniensis) str. MADAR]MDR1804794.1 50S ribosomal protein L4 [Flavobacteriales bacterium]
MEIKILDIKGNWTNRKVEFNDAFFSKKSYDHSIYLEIKRYLSAQRQGTHKSKERGEVSGSTRKIHKQKGTGESRKGNIKNPIFKGGGRVFGPRPRRYFEKINKSTRNLVRKTIIEYKLKTNKVRVIEDIQLEKPNTKFIFNLLRILHLKDEKSLMIVGIKNKNLYLSSRNLKKFKLLNVEELDCYSLLNFLYIIFSESSVNRIRELFMN